MGMLESIIQNELIKFSEDISRQNNENVINANKEIETVLSKISDKVLEDILENATDHLMLAYSEMYFREGFLTALKLLKEINKVS